MREKKVTYGFDYRDDEENQKRYGSAEVPEIAMEGLS